MVFLVKNFSKEQLITSITDAYEHLSYKGATMMDLFGVTASCDTNGISLVAYPEITIGSKIPIPGFIPRKTRYYYRAYIACENELIKVYMPKILEVEVDGGSYRYDSFPRFLYVHSLCKKDGTHQHKKAIEDIESVFNFIIFGPIFYMQEEKIKESIPDVDW